MSTAVFPTLAGLGWDVPRTEIWKNTVQENVSGKESRSVAPPPTNPLTPRTTTTTYVIRRVSLPPIG